MCAHSLERAKAQGFRAMQFNFVVSSNQRAVTLWKSLGFEIVGEIPEAFRPSRAGIGGGLCHVSQVISAARLGDLALVLNQLLDLLHELCSRHVLGLFLASSANVHLPGLGFFIPYH